MCGLACQTSSQEIAGLFKVTLLPESSTIGHSALSPCRNASLLGLVDGPRQFLCPSLTHSNSCYRCFFSRLGSSPRKLMKSRSVSPTRFGSSHKRAGVAGYGLLNSFLSHQGSESSCSHGQYSSKVLHELEGRVRQS